MQQYLHLLTNTGLNLPTDLWLAATDRIGPQRAWQAALGTTYTFGESGYVASLEGYYKDMRGLIEYAPGASFISPGEDWQDKVEVGGAGGPTGVEAFLRKKRGRTSGWVGYTLSWSGRQFDALNEGGRLPLPLRPPPRPRPRPHARPLRSPRRRGRRGVYGTGQAVTLASARFFDGRLLDVRYVDGTLRPPQLQAYGLRGGYRMAAYHRLDVALSWHLKKAFFVDAGESTLSLGAYNLYNRKKPLLPLCRVGPQRSAPVPASQSFSCFCRTSPTASVFDFFGCQPSAISGQLSEERADG